MAGPELVQLAANGDILNCRLILEREKLRIDNQVNKNSTEDPVSVDISGLPEDTLSINFVNSKHIALQVAAQNGHIDLCRLLISEFDANVEYQVQED